MFRDFVLGGKLAEVEVDTNEGKVRFADKYSFPASAATAFRREGVPAQYYPLGVIVNYVKFKQSGKDVSQYIRQFPQRGDQVALADRNVSGTVVVASSAACQPWPDLGSGT